MSPNRARAGRLTALAAVLCAAAAGDASPLRDRITDLACGDRAAKLSAIEQLEQAPTGALGLPDESLVSPATEVDAHVVDRLLDVLAGVRVQLPELAARVDALVASWNYCAVTAGERLWDVRWDGSAISRAQSIVPAPLAGRGFAAWGLLPRAAAGRPVATGGGADVGSCDTALTSLTPFGPLAVVPVVAGADESCVPPPAAPPVVTAPAAAPPERQPGAGAPRPEPPAASRSHQSSPRSEVLASTGTVMPAALGITVTAFLRQSLTRKLDGGIAVSWIPRPSWFVRAAVSWALAVEFSRGANPVPTWSWGLGYDDWHPGTWSLQLNQWGPVMPGDGWKMVQTAALELAYKIPVRDPLGTWLAAKVAVTTGLQRFAPTGSVSLTLKLPHAVFASVSIAERLRELGRPNWTYVIGRATWAAGSLSLILANFGPNLVLQPNFVAHTALTVSWSWAW